MHNVGCNFPDATIDSFSSGATENIEHHGHPAGRQSVDGGDRRLLNHVGVPILLERDDVQIHAISRRQTTHEADGCRLNTAPGPIGIGRHATEHGDLHFVTSTTGRNPNLRRTLLRKSSGMTKNQYSTTTIIPPAKP